MHHGHAERSTYTGSYGPAFPVPGPMMYPAARSFCRSCCHPRPSCCCSSRECRKEAKELLVKSTLKESVTKDNTAFHQMAARAAFVKPFAAARGTDSYAGAANLDAVAPAAVLSFGVGSAFIGGSCCVHLSIEYVPSTPTVTGIVAVIVDDSEGTVMAWGKQEKAGAGYQIKEGIITTKPGAELGVIVVNMTARVRWCEIFSC